MYLSKKNLDDKNNERNLVKSFEILKSQKNDLENRKLLYDIIVEFYKNNRLDKLDESSKLLLKLSSTSNDTLNLGIAFETGKLECVRGDYRDWETIRGHFSNSINGHPSWVICIGFNSIRPLWQWDPIS